MAAKISVEKLVNLLSNTGFIQKGLKEMSYANGPAGTLLRHNIICTWWDKMVIKSESSFPVSGTSADAMQDFFPIVLQLMNRTTPFSLARLSQHKRESVSSNLDVLLNPLEETRMQFLHVCLPASASQTFDQIVNTRSAWWKQYSCNSTNFTQENVSDDQTLGLHIQYTFPWGPETIETIFNNDKDFVVNIEKKTGTKCQVINGKKSTYPSLIQCSTSVELAMAVFLTDAYTETTELDNTQDHRQKLQLHPAHAPFKVAVCCSGEKRREVQEVATYITREMRNAGIQVLHTRDSASTPDVQIIRYDEMGIPFTVIINDKTIETGTVFMRSRDTTVHEQLAIKKLTEYIKAHVTYQPPS